MANPTFISKSVQNPAEQTFSNVSAAVVEAWAEARRAEGYKVRVTRCFNGVQRVRPGYSVKVYINRAFAYKVAK